MADADAFLSKSLESLASAEDDLASARYNACARNAYYAAFQAAVVALMAEGISPRRRWEHEFVQAEFQGRLVYRRKLYPVRLRRALSEAYHARSVADYTERREADKLVSMARALVTLVEERLRGGS